MCNRKIKLRYYSGTGNTKYVAETFKESFLKKGCSVDLKCVSEIICEEKEPYEMGIVIFPVHAFCAPEGIYEWVERLDTEVGKAMAVISVSGGGEIGPNKGSRHKVIQLLEKKGFTIFYENMIVMPSNIFIPTDSLIEKMLFQILPKVIQVMTTSILLKEMRRCKVGIGSRIMSALGESEKKGANWFGKNIQVKDSCIGCGWCSQGCPSNNIEMKNGKPTFGKKCHLCLKCIYGCPMQSLYPRYCKSFILKEGYRIEKIEKRPPAKEGVEWESNVKGILWKGVKQYIEKWEKL